MTHSFGFEKYLKVLTFITHNLFCSAHIPRRTSCKKKKRMHALSCNCTKDAQQASGACIPRPLCTNTAAGAIKAASAGRSLDIKWAWGMFAALSKQCFNIWNGTGALTF